MIVGADAGPLIALAKLDRLDVLDMFGAPVVVPPYVRRELLSKPASETKEIERALERRIEVHDVPALGTRTKEVVGRLDPGEREAVALSTALDEKTLLIMDDRAGRRAARHLDCPVTGVIGVLLRAKERERIDAVTPLLRELQEGGYWLSDEIIEHARELADEPSASSENPDQDAR